MNLVKNVFIAENQYVILVLIIIKSIFALAAKEL